MIPYSRPKRSDLYTLSYSKLLENHTLHSYMAHTYIAHIKAVTPPRGPSLPFSYRSSSRLLQGGVRHTICYCLKKAKTCLNINWIPTLTLMTLKLFPDICWYRWTWIETWKNRANTQLSSFNPMLHKNHQNIIMVSALPWSLFDIFFITLQEHFVVGLRY